MHMARLWIWAPIAIAYTSFWLWYTPLGGPLTPDEIESAVQGAQETDADALRNLRRFLAADDGRPFLMVNLIERAEPGRGAGSGAAAEPGPDELLRAYAAHVVPELLSRASHPVVTAAALHDSLSVVGIAGAEKWGSAVLVRYRSRRDFLAIVSDPRFARKHRLKLAALSKTIVFPSAPQLFLGDPRLLLALALFALAALLDLVTTRRARS